MGPAAVCAGGRRPAREIATREPDGSEWSISRPALALPPPTGTTARPSGPSDALHTSGAGSLMCGSARRLEARPGPATAHGHRSQALRTPNVVWSVVLGFWGAPLCAVTNVVNRRCFSCGFLIRCYKRRQSEGFFAENQGFWTQIDDVCNMSTRKGGSNCSGLTTFVTSAARWLLGQAPPPPTGAAARPCRPGGPVV